METASLLYPNLERKKMIKLPDKLVYLLIFPLEGYEIKVKKSK